MVKYLVKFELKGKAMKRSIVRKQGNSGHIYLPKAWIDHEVIIVVDPED